MNYTPKLLILSLAAATAVLAQDSNSAAAGATAAPATAPAAVAPEPAFTHEQVLEELGWYTGRKVGISNWALTPDETAVVLKGVNEAFGGKDSPYDINKIGPFLKEFYVKKQEAVLEQLREKGTAEATAYFSKLRNDKSVVELTDGLRYSIVAPGAGVTPTAKDYVKVNYTGTFLNGTVFDSSERSGKPAEFQLSSVIAGWTEGLQKISKGGKIRLYVPANLAYGEEGNQAIAPNSALIFDVELLDVSPTPFTAAPGK